jgi:hypothetical protein
MTCSSISSCPSTIPNPAACKASLVASSEGSFAYELLADRTRVAGAVRTTSPLFLRSIASAADVRG